MDSFPVKLSSFGKSKGTWRCTVSEEGMVIANRETPKKFEIPVGSKIQSIKPGVFALPENNLTITVAGLTLYQHGLARDLVTFIMGDGPVPKKADYSIEPYFYVLSFLPLGIPIMTMGGFLPFIFGWAIFMACYLIVQQDHWPKIARLIACASSVAAGYALAALLFAGVGNFVSDLITVITGSSPRGEESYSVAAKEEEDLEADLDEDGLFDRWEYMHFPNLERVDRDSDYDEDGVPEWEELENLTYPDSDDTDEDLLPDRIEIDHDLEPNGRNLLARMDFEIYRTRNSVQFDNRSVDHEGVCVVNETAGVVGQDRRPFTREVRRDQQQIGSHAGDRYLPRS